MKKILKNHAEDIILALGVVVFEIGTFQIYIPAGFMSLGVCMVAYAVLYANSAGKSG